MTDERQAAPSVTFPYLNREKTPISDELLAALGEAVVRRFAYEDALQEAFDLGAEHERAGSAEQIRDISERFGKLKATPVTSARPPAPSDSLEQAIAECEAKGWATLLFHDVVTGSRRTINNASVFVTHGYKYRGEGETLLSALRAAMSAALAAASGEPAKEEEA